jgi:hypothetical protein
MVVLVFVLVLCCELRDDVQTSHRVLHGKLRRFASATGRDHNQQ